MMMEKECIVSSFVMPKDSLKKILRYILFITYTKCCTFRKTIFEGAGMPCLMRKALIGSGIRASPEH